MKCTACDFEYQTSEEFNNHWQEKHDGEAVTPEDKQASTPSSADSSVGVENQARKPGASIGKPARKPRSDKGKPRQVKQAVAVSGEQADVVQVIQVVAGKKTRKSRAKPNITLADMDGLYLSPQGQVYRLTECCLEPEVTMVCLSDGTTKRTFLSEFADYVRLIPQRR